MSKHSARPARSKRRPFVAFVATSLVATAAVLGVTPGSSGAIPPVSEATGDFLSGTALSVNLATLVALQNASAVNTGSPATVSSAHPLDVTALSAVNVPLGGGLQLLGGVNPILDLGAANQYARANNDGSSYGASGAVTDQGAISIGGPTPGPQGQTSLNLNPVTTSLGLGSVLSNFQLGIGAIAGTATQTAGGVQSGDYAIANVGLDLTSPLVAGIKQQLTPVVSGLQSLLDGLSTTLSGVLCPLPPLPCVLAVTPPNLQTTLDALTTVSLAGGSLVLNLNTGTIHLDVGAFLAFHGVDINTLAPNTDLTALLHTLLAGDLTTGLTSTLQTLVTDLTNAINTTTITLGGIPISAGQLTAALAPIISQLTSGVQTIIDGLVPNVIDPLLNAVDQIAQITINKQTSAGGTFTETALAISVVPASPLATVNLASASVGPNGGPVAPTSASISPDQGPTAGGQTVTLTGTGFVPGATTVTIGGITIPANQVTVAPDGQSLTFVTPPHAAGVVTVTATTAGGTTGPQNYAYIPAPTTTSLTPTSGPTSGGTTVTITGTNFIPGATSVTIGGNTVAANNVTVAPDGNSLTFVTPAHTVGTVQVTTTTPGGTSSPPLSFTYIPSPPVITSPTDGSTVGSGTHISGTGEPGSTVTVTEGGTTICTATVDSSGHWTCTPSTPLAAGEHTIVATQVGPGGETSAPSSPVTFTVVDAPTASSLSPDQGVETGGTTVTISGTNFVPGQTSVTIGGIKVPASAVTVSSDGTSLTFVTPAHPVGPVDVTVTTPGGTSSALKFTYLPAPPVITSPTDGEVTGGQPQVSGTGHPGYAVTVTDAAGNVVCTAVVDSSGHWACTPSKPFTGPTKLFATQTSPDGLTSAPSEPVHLTLNELAATGAEPWRPAVSGLLMLLVGLALAFGARRLNRQAA